MTTNQLAEKLGLKPKTVTHYKWAYGHCKGWEVVGYEFTGNLGTRTAVWEFVGL